jgi:hypothetical protein
VQVHAHRVPIRTCSTCHLHVCMMDLFELASRMMSYPSKAYMKILVNNHSDMGGAFLLQVQHSGIDRF